MGTTELNARLDALADARDEVIGRLAAVERGLDALVAELGRAWGSVGGLGRAARSGPGDGERLMDTRSLAERWGVSVRTVDNEVASGRLVPTFVRGARRFTPESVRSYERANSGPRRRRTAERRTAAHGPARAEDRPAISGRNQ